MTRGAILRLSRLAGRSKAARRCGVLIAIGSAGLVGYETSEGFRHTVLAVDRCARIGHAVIAGALDYKQTLGANYENVEAELEAQSACHLRSAKRLLWACQINGGIYVKLGQHMSSVNLLPLEWTSTMRPLQDQCHPTPYEKVVNLLEKECGRPLAEMYSDFSPEPIGVASLAQVHVARDRDTGRKVAVKIQHPHLEEFAAIDIATTTFALSWVKRLFPEFEFSWLGEEMATNLPLELDFVHEAANTDRARSNFSDLKRTSVYFPEVLRATKRTLVMEFIDGARVDDLRYLAKHNIDRNQVSRELSAIFSKMVYLDGFFHADPHAGNLLVRPSSVGSRSSHNFEIALLDHGLYFDIDPDLRVNYARLWLSLILPGHSNDRRKYAELVGNIGPELYPIFESAITGRAGLEGTWEDDSVSGLSDSSSSPVSRAGSLLDMSAQSEEEIDVIRAAVMQREGLMLSVFSMLRRMPRRVLMLFKLNDLTRNLDTSLKTTHGSARVFLIVAQYASLASWHASLQSFRERPGFFPSLSSIISLAKSWWEFHLVYDGLRIVGWAVDTRAKWVKAKLWLRAWVKAKGATEEARNAAAGLVVV